ncbi:DUF6493 family protein [Streptomyces sp. NPDC047028]|uniref:DUF7824 domain-containing protein n=1 Tax=Streptomyces sp. NPDC047028 TaxID=3155793 RepID=UPI0033E6A351
MNDFNTWLEQFAGEDSEAGQFVRQVRGMPDWPADERSRQHDYVQFTFRPPWGDERQTAAEPLTSLWNRYTSERLGPVAVPSGLRGDARDLAVALEDGGPAEVTDLCRRAVLLPEERRLILARALQVIRVHDAADFGWDRAKGMGARLRRMCTVAIAWHPDAAEAARLRTYTRLDDDTVVDLVATRGPGWLAEFARAPYQSYGVVRQLAGRLGVAVEPTPRIACGCLEDHVGRRADAKEKAAVTARRLREDPLAAAFLPSLPDALPDLRHDLDDAAARIIAAAVDEGIVERRSVIAAVAETLRANDDGLRMTGYVRLMERLAPTEEEFAPYLDLWTRASVRVEGMPGKLLGHAVTALARQDRLPEGQVAEWVRVLRDGPATVAKNAVTSLGVLADDRRHLTDEDVADVLAVAVDGGGVKAAAAVKCVQAYLDAGRLTEKQLADWAASVLFRPERTVVNAALQLLERALRADPDLAGVLVPELTAAFAHPSADTRQRALTVIGAYRDRLDEEARALVAEAAGQLPAALREQAAELLGEPPAPEARPIGAPYVEHLPAPAPASTLPPPMEDAQEVAAELNAVLSARTPEPIAVERVLDGLVRLAHRNRQALAEAVHPVLHAHDYRVQSEDGRVEVSLVAMAVAGRTDAALLDGTAGHVPHDGCGHRVFGSVITARIVEAARRTEAGEAPPFLLATPSLSTGELEPRVLLERLRAYQRLGVRVGEADFDQALFRLGADPGVPPSAADALGTPEGRRLARWMTDGRFPAPVGEQTTLPPPTYPDDPEAAHRCPRCRLIRVGTASAGDRLKGFGPAFRVVGDAYAAQQDDCSWAAHEQSWRRAFPQWLAVLPGHPEAVVTRTLAAFAEGAECDRPCAAVHLPAVAEAPGPAGPAVYLALAYGMGAAGMPERTATADALLQLLGREALDTGRLGRTVAELIGIDALKLNRIADTLRPVASQAPASVYAILAAVLPPVLPADGGSGRAGLAGLLALAAECAQSAPGRPPIAGLSALAARRSGSLLVRTARMLLDSVETAH